MERLQGGPLSEGFRNDTLIAGRAPGLKQHAEALEPER